ncbi:MAG: ABC transporter substrate-binding protein [Pseudonocardiaceae bacterium]
MRKDTRATWRVLLAVTVLLVAAGCAGATDPKPGTELVWAVGGLGAADAGPAHDIANQWNALHPHGPRVRVEALPETTDDQHQLLTLELNAGLSHFDILNLDVIWTAEFAQKGWLVDLDTLRPEIEQVSLPQAVQTAVWQGKLWAAPYTTDVGILYYRKDLVHQPPATWEELDQVGRQVGAQHQMAPYVADGARYEGLVVQYLEYLWAAGGRLLDPDAQSVLFQTAPALKALTFMETAFRTGLYAPGFDTMNLEDARATFQSGQAVFMRSWPYAYQQMNHDDPTSQVKGKIGVAPLPTFAGSAPVAALGGGDLAVSKFSRDVPDATEFVKFVSTSRAIQRELAERYSVAPTLKAAYDDVADDPMMTLLTKVLPTARPRPATPEWSTISEQIQQQVFAGYTGNAEPRQVIAGLHAFLVATVGG